MGNSNDDWGTLAEQNEELAQLWDTFARLPEPGENWLLDKLCEQKQLDIGALVRIGARLPEYDVLAVSFPDGIKFRGILTGDRWSTLTEFKRLKIVRASEPATKVVVAEGETDAARLTMLFPGMDVAIMPAGAKRFIPSFAEQLADYEQVLVGLDADEAGEAGWEKIKALVPHAQRFAPPANDWCEATEVPDIPNLVRPLPLLVTAGELLGLEAPEHVSWYEQAVLPVAGQLVIHGWVKSFKSFVALDLLASLAQGKDWCCFEPTEEACRVAVVQFEIPWAYYQDRVRQLANTAPQPELFKENFHTYSPLSRPILGERKEQDRFLKTLIENDIQVVSIDPLRRMAGGLDLNSEQDVRVLLSFFERVQDEGITVVFCHHNRKEGGKRGSEESMTGSGAFSGDADSIVSIQLPHKEKVESPRRNIGFLLRNAPSPGPRAMEMQEDGHILYSPDTYAEEADDEHAPAI